MNEGANNNSRNQRRKPQYSGGLVLEPHPGLYDDIILVMDFNSLYPSIIQEYNISFETVIRKATQSFKEENNWNNNAKMNKDKNKKAKKNKKTDKKDDNKDENNDDKSGDDKTDDEKEEVIKEDEEEDEDKVVEISDKIRFKSPPATLPSILRFLVGERKNVKNQQKIEKDKFKRSLLEIKQKSLKISANSLYGYLGYKNSRFYAKEIAALITKTGRRILRNAAHIVDKFGYKIIYGDTDSVMVNTMTQNIKEAVEIGNKLNKEINKQYKLLIIDIDGVFKSMLLLKKKKYACLKYLPPYTDPNKIERELKGVDLVRRDWSPLSKNTGLKILDIILSGKSKDDIISGIYDELKKVSEDIDNNKIELKDYAITKQLAKNIDDYHDLKALPHVQVAKRLREQGKRNFQIHSFIPYVICLFKEDENNDNIPQKIKTISDRAYHPKEIENDPTLKIDYLWYKENQILPVVKRLVQHISEITINQLCESLGIENKAHDFYQEQNNENSNENNDKTTIKKRQVINLKVRGGLLFKCPNCNKVRHINNLKNRDDCIRTITRCDKCKAFISKSEDFQKIANIIKNTAKNLIFLYYRKKSTCSICKESNNTLFCRTKCSDKTCKVYMEIDYDEMSIYQELKFLNELVNIDIKESDPRIKELNEAFKNVEKYIKNMTNKISFTKINISELFSFLNS
jgi:DNA polymerase alpha subunit A